MQDSMPDRINSSLPEEAASGERNNIERNKGTSGPADPVSSGIPDVPTYSEEKSIIVYPKEYRLLSLNFQRGIGSGSEKIASEIFNITGKTSGYDIKDACDVFDYVNRHWKYRYDENAEFFFGAAQTINDGYKGDCDDYSIVVSALLRNMGFNTRIVTATNEGYGHAYPELYIGDNKEAAYEILGYVHGRYPYAESILCSGRELEGGEIQYWLNFDWSGSNGSRHPGGAYFEGAEVIYYPNGLIEFRIRT
ncbi:transglutaminase domain-containing protein [Methanosarcina sp. MSH10X1]|nr:transglutaminase domain-containing protein [Methanosarcina sp. MSH10X1]